MPSGEKNNLMTIALAIVIIIALVALVYTYMPTEDNKEDDTTADVENNTVLLTINFRDQQNTYTLSELEQFDSYTGDSKILKQGALPEVIINGPTRYTGVKMTTILSEMQNLPDTYNITVTASDGWQSQYTYQQIQGNVTAYDENTGDTIGNSQVNMVLAYKQENEYLTNETDGPLKLVFLENDTITSSRMISKYVTSITINEPDILELEYADTTKKYSLYELEQLESLTGVGSKIKTKALPTVIINGPNNYTGVKISTFVNQFSNPPMEYNITTYASDGWQIEYSYNETQGLVDIYNQSGNITATGGVTMILAYMQDSEYISEDDGPLRIAFVDDGKITSSRIWAKMVEKIVIQAQ